MSYLSATPIQYNTHLIPAGLAIVVAGLFSAVHLSLFGQSWPLTWLPFAVVALWPRRAAPVPSGILLLGAGLWVDWTTLGAPGQWALVFLVTYTVLRPDRAERERGVTAAMARFALAILIGLPVLILSGRFVYGSWPDWAALTRGLVLIVLLLPLIAFARDAIAKRLSREDF